MQRTQLPDHAVTGRKHETGMPNHNCLPNGFMKAVGGHSQWRFSAKKQYVAGVRRQLWYQLS